MKTDLPKVLFIDDQAVRTVFKDLIDQKCELLEANTIEEGRELYNHNQDAALIILDACIPGHDINTVALLQEIRQSYKGIIIAASSHDPFVDRLIEAGCNCGGGKLKAFQIAAQFLESGKLC